MKELKQKYIFLDSNIFLSCLFNEKETIDADFLSMILKGIKKANVKLLFPDIIYAEVKAQIQVRCSNFLRQLSEVLKVASKKQDSKGFANEIEKKVKVEALRKAKKEISEKEANSLKLMEQIYTDDNTIKLLLSDQTILRALRRSLLMQPPKGWPGIIGEQSTRKQAFTKDQDCAAFESVVHFARTNKSELKNAELVLCTDDSDYFQDEEKQRLKKEIMDGLSDFANGMRSYSNPLEMYNSELSAEYTQDEIREYEKKASENLSEYVNPVYATHNGSITSFFFGKTLPRDAQFCTQCGKSISNLISSRPLEFSSVHSASILINERFICPYCGTNFSLV